MAGELSLQGSDVYLRAFISLHSMYKLCLTRFTDFKNMHEKRIKKKKNLHERQRRTAKVAVSLLNLHSRTVLN